MRLLQKTVLSTVAIFALLAFQMATGPLMVCVAASGEILAVAPSAENCAWVWFLGEEKQGSAPTGCSVTVPSPERIVGCCGESSARPWDSDFAAGQTNTKNSGEPSHYCPRPFMPCCRCVPVERDVEAGYVQAVATRGIDFAAYASQSLAYADRQRANVHAHAPPLVTIVQSGNHLCITKCSFLL